MRLFKKILTMILALIAVIGVLPMAVFADRQSADTDIELASSVAGLGDYKITTDSLRVRSGPSTSYTKLGSVTKGQIFTVTEISDDWGKITYNGATGWICLDYAVLVTDNNTAVSQKQFTLSSAGLQMIKGFEGYRQYKYWDGGHYSIGYGSTCGTDDYPNGISEAEASELLVSRMASYENGLDEFLYNNGIKVSQAQYDALVSFTYNFGNPWTRWDEFDLKTILIKGAYNYSAEEITDAFCQFVKSGGVVVQGLVSRRTKEAQMFISGTVFYQTGSFKDVYTRDWYYEAVEFVNEKGIMTGISSSKFSPTVQLTRAMMVTTLAKMGGVRMDAYKGKTSFDDVEADDWFAPYVEWAYRKGITSGVGDGSFAPDKPITRQDLIVMLYNFVKIAGYKVQYTDSGLLNEFDDAAKISPYAVNAVKWALERDIISGNGADMLNPLSRATRAETAQMMKNYYENGRVW